MQSDQGLHCLPFILRGFHTILYGKTVLKTHSFNIRIIKAISLASIVQMFKKLTFYDCPSFICTAVSLNSGTDKEGIW